jgi:hypothetical protein
MSGQPHQGRRLTDFSYRDRIDLANDFEVLNTREGRVDQASSFVTSTERLPQRGTVWTAGNSWEPEDDVELALDPSSAFYDEALEGQVTVDDPVWVRPSKKKKSMVSVSLLFLLASLFNLIFCWKLEMSSCCLEGYISLNLFGRTFALGGPG